MLTYLRRFIIDIILIAPLSLLGCTGPTNPSFNTTPADARDAIRAMRDAPAKPTRPILVLGPFVDPAIAEWQMRRQVRKAFEPDQVVGVSFAFWSNFDACRDKVIAALEDAYPSDDPHWTTEVDVIAYSMGGVVARYAASPPQASADLENSKRLKIARLYTVNSPHRGSALACAVPYLPLTRAMTPGSDFLAHLDQHAPAARYTLTPYTRLYDAIVHPTRAAPVGQTVRWVPNRLFSPSHLGALRDPRIMADILCRLRHETPLSTDPPAPLPQ